MVIAACVISGLMVAQAILRSPQDVRFPAAYSEQKQENPAITQFSLVPRIAVSKPNLSNSELFQWLTNAVTASFSVDSQQFANEQMADAVFFTENGWAQFNNILNGMYQFNSLTSKDYLISTLRPQGAPIIDNKGVSQGRYMWVIELPVVIHFNGTVQVPDQSMTLKIIVIRTPMDSDIDGVKIEQIQALNVKKLNIGTPIPQFK